MFKKLKAYRTKVYMYALAIAASIGIANVAQEATKMYEDNYKNGKR